MSTHTIGFYEDLTKIIFELSSNIINYTPYFFCCYHYQESQGLLICSHRTTVLGLEHLFFFGGGGRGGVNLSIIMFVGWDCNFF